MSFLSFSLAKAQGPLKPALFLLKATGSLISYHGCSEEEEEKEKEQEVEGYLGKTINPRPDHQSAAEEDIRANSRKVAFPLLQECSSSEHLGMVSPLASS